MKNFKQEHEEDWKIGVGGKRGEFLWKLNKFVSPVKLANKYSCRSLALCVCVILYQSSASR